VCSLIRSSVQGAIQSLPDRAQQHQWQLVMRAARAHGVHACVVDVSSFAINVA
jgi:hypothetical protein